MFQFISAYILKTDITAYEIGRYGRVVRSGFISVAQAKKSFKAPLSHFLSI